MLIQSITRPISLAGLAWKTWRSTAWSPDSRDDVHPDIESLVEALGHLKGPVVKMAQMLAMIPGILPKAYADALLSLCSQSKPMHWAMVTRRMTQALGPNWQNHFLTFEKTPSFAASLGQVHRAELLDGLHVAVKIQYPAMRGAIESDLLVLKTLLRLLDPRQHSVKVKNFESEWKTRLIEELDYDLEATHMLRWSVLFEKNPRVIIPQPIGGLSSSQLLTMTFLNSLPMSQAMDADAATRNRLGRELFSAWYTPFYQAGMMHGDPHIGNMGWDDERLYLFDFGCARLFSPDFVQSFCTLYRGILTNNRELTRQSYAQWGFHPISKTIADALNIWARFLLEPFLTDQYCSIDAVSNPDQGRQALLNVYAALRKEGGTSPPAEFLIFDRVAVILGALLVRLQSKSNWFQLMQSFIENFSYDACVDHQNRLLAISMKNGILNTHGAMHRQSDHESALLLYRSKEHII
jgi:predicted unusual protein kinase regulating ubiquinone biosynthesis (AarF/ABC1/UbiB family)